MKTFIGKLPQAAHVVMEATGVYHFPLAFALQDTPVPCTVLNLTVSAGFARSMNSISKTDKAEVPCLLVLGKKENPDRPCFKGMSGMLSVNSSSAGRTYQ
jgi:transposase